QCWVAARLIALRNIGIKQDILVELVVDTGAPGDIIFSKLADKRRAWNTKPRSIVKGKTVARANGVKSSSGQATEDVEQPCDITSRRHAIARGVYGAGGVEGCIVTAVSINSGVGITGTKFKG